MHNRKNRPVFLNLLRIRMPVSAIQSIMHRIFGVLMVLLLPLAIYLFDLSLRSPQDFERVSEFLASPAVCFIGAIPVWALAHHLFAGIRYLLLDVEWGLQKNSARLGAWLVNIAGLLVLLIYLGLIFGGTL